MREEHIKLEWIKDGKSHEREVDRKQFYDIMNGIRKGFEEDNRISTFFCDYIADLWTIHINMDRNNEIDTPFVVCKIKDKVVMLNIIRHHKIIWSILEGYCKE